MRDVVLLLALAASLPFALRSAMTAYMLWVWANLATLGFYAFGFMNSMPFVQIFAICTMIAMAVNSKEVVGAWVWTRVNILFVLLAIHMVACSMFAYDGLPRNVSTPTDFMKNAVCCLLMPLFVVSRTRIVMIALCLAIGVGTFGVVEGIKLAAPGGGAQGLHSKQVRRQQFFRDVPGHGLLLGAVLCKAR